MQSTELRIGNVVWEDYGGYKIITAINSNSKGDFPNSVSARALNMSVSGQYGLDEIKPIPLTPELLEKCGFGGKYKSCGYLYTKDILSLSSQDEDDEGNAIENYVFHVYHDHRGAAIYFLHQLQNLYFALTGEELLPSM